MKRGIITAVIMVVLTTPVMLVGCRQSESERAKSSPEEHQQAMVKKSFDESKKVTVATVNGEAITMFTLLREMNTVAPGYAAAGQARTPALDAKIRKDALNTVILQALAVQEAKKRGMQASPELIDSGIQKIKTGLGSGDAFRKYLEDNGLTEAELRKAIEQDALFEMIAGKEIDEKIQVTEAALRARYQKEKAGLRDSRHKQMTYEEAKGVIEQKVRAEAAEKRMREWEKELKKGARIEIVEPKQKQG